MSTHQTALRSAVGSGAFFQKAWAMLVAVALCLGLMPSTAWAAEGTGSGEVFSVALTVVDSTDPANGIVKNVKVDGMTADKTVADLLAAAGFASGSQEQSAANPEGTYFVSNGAPYFLGKGYDATAGTYWSTIFDGNVDPEGYKKAMLDAKLTANGHYQYVYGTEYTFSYSAAVPQLVMNAVNNPLPAGSVPDPDPDPVPDESDGKIDPPVDQYQAAGVDSNDLTTLAKNIIDSYEGSTNAWQVMDRAAAGVITSAEKEAFVSAALADMKNPSADSAATALQRNIIALTAVGVDATAVPDGSSTYDAVAAMAQKVTASSPINVRAFTLLAYACGGYAVPVDANLPEGALISGLREAQLADGGFSYSGSKADADMTAMVITALAPYASKDANTLQVVNKALAALKSLQNDDGGFSATGMGMASGTNANSTAMAVIALCACGIDPATSWATENGATPLSALLSQATSDLTGFVYNGNVNESSTEQGLRALVAYQGLKNTGAAYNVYTQAKLGQAVLPKVKKEEEQQEENASKQPASCEVPGAKPLAKTADQTVPFAASAAAVALCALAGGVAASRRVRKDRELTFRR